MSLGPQSVKSGAWTYKVASAVPCATPPARSTEVRVTEKLPVGTPALPAIYVQVESPPTTAVALQSDAVSEETVPGAGFSPIGTDSVRRAT